MRDDLIQSRAFSLLSLAKTIRHYEKALSSARGERFCLFAILRIEHDEVRTHSRVLGELLNPRGSHGQGAVFLKHFFAELEINGFDAEPAQVELEVSLGPFGRLDIEIRSGNRSIYIENKICAELHSDQLIKYHRHNPEAKLLFLTLQDEDPADWAVNPAYRRESFRKVFQKINYKENILRWLESCRKEATTAPGVREVITQYMQLIQRLTHQNTSTAMSQELTKAALNDKESFLAFSALCEVQQEVHAQIFKTLEIQLARVASQLGLIPNLPIGEMRGATSRLSLSSPMLQELGLCIAVEFGSRDFQNCFFGFRYLTHCETPTAAQTPLQRAFERDFRSHGWPNAYWHAWCNWDEHRNWGAQTLAAIQFGSFEDDLRKLLTRLVNVANEASTANPVTLVL